MHHQYKLLSIQCCGNAVTFDLKIPLVKFRVKYEKISFINT